MVFSEELMNEVKALQDSIREFCPEIESSSSPEDTDWYSGDEMNELIAHRIQLLSDASKKPAGQFSGPK